MGKFSQKARWILIDSLCSLTVIGFFGYSLLGIVALEVLLTIPRAFIVLFFRIERRKGREGRWERLKKVYTKKRWKLLLPDMDAVTLLFLAVNGVLFALFYLLIARDLEMWRFIKEKPEIFCAIFKELFTV